MLRKYAIVSIYNIKKMHIYQTIYTAPFLFLLSFNIVVVCRSVVNDKPYIIMYIKYQIYDKPRIEHRAYTAHFYYIIHYRNEKCFSDTKFTFIYLIFTHMCSGVVSSFCYTYNFNIEYNALYLRSS